MQPVVRLINQFIPKNYQLSISLNRVDRTFEGIVIVEGSSTTESNTILLHCKELVINSALIDGVDSKYAFDTNDTLVLSQDFIAIGEHTISISFCGKISDAMHGMYPCYYDHNGVKKELLATQFESHHAREVFPCIDEPEAKATYDVVLKTETNITVLGNMPIKTQTIDKDILITTFQTTPMMSSYLLAWVVGELHKKTAYTKSGVEVNVWATPAQPADNLDFALDIATRSIDFFDEYFDTPYPLPKCDHVALPDFSSGAMENWGLITYREIALLADPITTSVSSKHYIAMVIAHELSHQWFGNLVTMKWWNDLWLNESFATLVEYIAVDALEPDWNVWLDFASNESIVSLRRDSIDGVQPVQTDVNHPDEISTLFDGAIVYAKGARLLRMLQKYIGVDAFQAGLKDYFKIHAYSNTQASDLWSAFSKASNKNVESFMTKWISQPGFPVVHASISNDNLILSQERLTHNSNTISDFTWPITLNSSSDELPKIFDDRTMTISITNQSNVRLNLHNDAHFITHYSAQLMNDIINNLKSGTLTAIDRLQLLNEQTLLAQAGIISSTELVQLLDSLTNETSEAVWNMICVVLSDLKKFVEYDEIASNNLRLLACKLAKQQYSRLGWSAIDKETDTDTKLRANIISLMLYGEYPDAISQSIHLYETTATEELQPELRSLILSSVVKHTDEKKMIDELIKVYKQTDSSDYKQDICAGLTSVKELDSISEILSLIPDTKIIRAQDTHRWLIYLLRNKHSRDITWKWLRDNWEWIKKTFSGDKSYGDYPRYIAGILSTESQLSEFCNFFLPMDNDPALNRSIHMGINEIKNRVETIKRDGQAVRDALLNL